MSTNEIELDVIMDGDSIDTRKVYRRKREENFSFAENMVSLESSIPEDINCVLSGEGGAELKDLAEEYMIDNIY